MSHRYPTDAECMEQALALLEEFDGHDDDGCLLCQAMGILMGTNVILIRTEGAA